MNSGMYSNEYSQDGFKTKIAPDTLPESINFDQIPSA
jgi:hypothetical protein